jgi:hypothetical protein
MCNNKSFIVHIGSGDLNQEVSTTYICNLFGWLHVINQAKKEMVFGWLNEYILH